MTTAIVSDLHLGAASGRDLARREPALAALTAALGDVDELVLLGDVVELRERRLSEAMAAARPALEAIDHAMAGRTVTVVAGNHDHQTVAPLIERLRSEGRALELETLGEAAPWLAACFRHSELRAAYPGVWVRADVYATHGHYLDVHNTVPTFERIAIGALQRVTTRIPPGRARPEHYEAATAPLYAFLYSLAQAPPGGGRLIRSDRSSAAWKAVAASNNGHRAALGRGAVRAAVGALNLAGVGPLESDLRREALRDSALRAMRTVIERLGIDARHVVFGHTHRSGPHPVDAGWHGLLNPGSWILEEAFLGDRPQESPYFPGHCVMVPDEGEPELVRLLSRLPSRT